MATTTMHRSIMLCVTDIIGKRLRATMLRHLPAMLPATGDNKQKTI